MKYLVFFGVGLLVVLPWFITPGYLFLLDWQNIPNPPFVHINETQGISGMPIQILLYVFTHLFSGAYAQSILLLCILSLAGIATARLAQHLLHEKTITIPSVTAGIFAMLNLFVYNRIQIGHVYLLAGYALTPLAILLALQYLKKPSIRTGIVASLMSALVLATSIHHIFLLPVILLVFIWNERRTIHTTPLQYAALGIPLTCVAGILLIAAFFHPQSYVHSLTQEDLRLFAPIPQCSQSLVLDTFLLASQWRNTTATHAPCSSPVFFAVSIILLGIMALGAFRHWRLAIGGALVGILTIVPLLPPMRDSAKFLADLALIESVLLAYAIRTIQNKHLALAILSLVVVCIAGFPLLWGASGTISTSQYPASWYEWEKELATLQEKPRVLFLPWHLYMPFDFTNGRTISNPAKHFFTNATVLQSNNPEMQQKNNVSIATPSEIEMVLTRRHEDAFHASLQELIEKEHIRYIALAHGSPEESEYKEILDAISFIKPIHNTPGLTVWQFGE